MRMKLVIILTHLLLLVSGVVFSQQKEIDLTEVNNDPQREEVQRYFGYESLLYRYLTQPYDISINVNQQGDFVDVGFLYLMFIPLLLLVLAGSRRLLFLGLFFAIVSIWIISTSNSFVFSPTEKVKIETDAQLEKYLQRTDAVDEPTSRLTAHIYSVSSKLYRPYEKLGSLISGNKDGVTYTILFLAFILISILLTRLLIPEKLEYRLLLVFTFLYSFYWLLFGGGIIWYCYIMFPVSMIAIFLLLKLVRKKSLTLGKIYKGLFYSFGAIWIMIAIVARLSSIQPQLTEDQLGKGMFYQAFYEYGTGKASRIETLEAIYPNLTKALARINSDEESIIYKVGTSFNYFIKNNHNRIYQDHQLGTFYWLLRSFEDKNEIAEVLKASNIKYLILDLNTPLIDNTPDEALKQKYRSLRRYINKNPTFKLLATDNVVKTLGAGNEYKYTYNTIGDTYYAGRYAIYEIL